MPKKNDPNKPSKGRTTAYAFFAKHYREEFAKKNNNQNLSFQEGSKQAAAVWKDMSESAKAPFQKLADKDKKRYDAEVEMLSRMPYVDTGNGKGRRAPKDKNAPKRALSAYMWFCHDERANLKAENSELSAPDTLRELGKRWNAVSEADKQKYEALYAKDKLRYEKEMKAYNGGAGATMAAASSKGGSGSRGGRGGAVATKAPPAKVQPKQAVTSTTSKGRGAAAAPVVQMSNHGDSSSEGDEEAMDESEEDEAEEEEDEESDE